MKFNHVINSVFAKVSFMFGLGVGLVGFTETAAAQSVIKDPTLHPHYVAELEPHFVFDAIGNDGIGIGLGGRATFVVLDPGFVSTINNTVGIGVGVDWLNGDDHCNPSGCYNRDRLVLPAVMQWNFWFTPHWSAFGEPGLAIRSHDGHADLDIALYVGGRFNFNDRIALTLRLGTPASSFGVSFFL